VPPEEVRDRLAGQTPPGLAILSACRIDPRAGVHVRGLSYGLAIPVDRGPALRLRIAEVLAANNCWIDRTRPPCRRHDLRPLIRHLRLTDVGSAAYLEADLLLTAAGTARPDEVLKLLGLEDLLTAGVVIERTRLELEPDNFSATIASAGGITTLS
jgi:hypothetical protein